MARKSSSFSAVDLACRRTVDVGIRGNGGSLGDNRHIVSDRPEPAARIRKIRWAELLRLPGDRHLDRVLEHRSRGCKQTVRQISIVVVHSRGLAVSAE